MLHPIALIQTALLSSILLLFPASGAQGQQPGSTVAAPLPGTTQDITGACKTEADAFVYPPPKNEKEARKQAREKALQEKLDARPNWKKAFDHPDYPRIKQERLWHTKFNECLRQHSTLGNAALTKAEAPLTVVDAAGHSFVTIDTADGMKAVPLTPVMTDSRKPSPSLFKYETSEHKVLFFYREQGSNTAREVVAVESADAHNLYLDKNGGFMLTLGRDGEVTYTPVNPLAPASTATPNVDHVVLKRRPSEETPVTPPQN